MWVINKHLWEAGRQEGKHWGAAHLGGRHILKGDMAIGQLTSCDSHAVDVRLGIITLQILSQEEKATHHSICKLGHYSLGKNGVELSLRRGKECFSPNQGQLRRLSLPTPRRAAAS